MKHPKEEINQLLDSICEFEFLTPYHAWYEVRTILEKNNVVVDKITHETASNNHEHRSNHESLMFDPEGGYHRPRLYPWGGVIGATTDGEINMGVALEHDLYLDFEWDPTDGGYYEVYAQIVTAEELDEIQREDSEIESVLD
jgi:hypothetical protein